MPPAAPAAASDTAMSVGAVDVVEAAAPGASGKSRGAVDAADAAWCTRIKRLEGMGPNMLGLKMLGDELGGEGGARSRHPSEGNEIDIL